MPRIALAEKIGGDFDRILEHLLQHEVMDAASRIGEIIKAIDVLERNPMIGRPVEGSDLRGLVIGHRSRGYVALYKFIAEADRVLVLAPRGQKEAGYSDTQV